MPLTISPGPAAFAILLWFTALPALSDATDGTMDIRRLAEGVYLHTSYGQIPGYGYYPSNGLVIVEDGSAYIIDTPWPVKDTPRLLAWIDARGYTAVASVSTHFHADRSSGIATLNEHGVHTHASSLTNQLLRESGKPEATHSFDAEGFWLLPDRIYVWHPGEGHSPDNVVVWLPRNKMIAGGCLVRSLDTQSTGNTTDANLTQWPASIGRVEARFPDAQRVVPGHGEPGGRELLAHTRRILEASNE